MLITLPAAALLLALPAPPPPPGDAPYPAGAVTERIVSASNPDHSYALYLPSAYDGEKSFPLLIGMDPRGAALYPLERMRPVAERLGYVIASSYNTLSDGPPNPNQAAIEAILADARDRLSIDFRRIYLVGFSGTARISWIFGFALRGRVAGLIGLGAGTPPTLDLEVAIQGHGTPFGFYGGAGRTDFNYEEVRTLDATLDRHRLPHRIEFYPGPHQWPPEEVFTRAVEWMELQAMRRELIPRDVDWLAAQFRTRREAAEAVAAAGDPLEALLRYRALRGDFESLLNTDAVAARVGELEKSKPVRRQLRRRERLATEYRVFVGTLRQFLREVATADPAPTLEESLYRLQIHAWQRVREKSTDAEERDAAERALALAFVQTSFYETRDFLAAGEPERAVALLGIAAAIRPGHPHVCLQLARAHAQAGRAAAAVEQLECVAATGRVRPDRLASDEYLAPLRGNEAYRELLQSLRDATEGADSE